MTFSPHQHTNCMTAREFSGNREAGVAGTFYPANRADIVRLMETALERERVRIDAHAPATAIAGGVVPHAGIQYCGRHAVHFFELLRRSGQQHDTVVIAHPNHHGYGPPISVDGHACWESPLGGVEVDTVLSDALDLPLSATAQEGEHSAEVLLPWLQYFLPAGFRIVPVNMLRQDPESAVQLAEKVHGAAKRLNRHILFLASSDFSHFLSPDEAGRRDKKVLDEIFRRNPFAVYQAVQRHRVSVCGTGPIMALMEYARLRDPAYRIRLLRKGHSGEVSDSDRVVSYVSLLVEGR
jgi:MEMO1 family protein